MFFKKRLATNKGKDAKELLFEHKLKSNFIFPIKILSIFFYKKVVANT
jgi:hypothetical protein